MAGVGAFYGILGSEPAWVLVAVGAIVFGLSWMFFATERGRRGRHPEGVSRRAQRGSLKGVVR